MGKCGLASGKLVLAREVEACAVNEGDVPTKSEFTARRAGTAKVKFRKTPKAA